MGIETKFKYYVVYFVCATNQRGSAIGRCFSDITRAIETQEDIEALQHRLEEDFGFGHNDITLINWKRIE